MRVLETDRLTIREFTNDDAPFILRLLNEPSFIENIADKGVRTLEDARAYLADGPMASYGKNGFGLWRVGTRDGDTPVGMCGLIRRDILPDVDIGYAFLPEHCAKGYALESAAAVMAYARDRVGLTRVVAVVDGANARSIRLLAKLGFVHESMVRMAADEPEICLYAKAV